MGAWGTGSFHNDDALDWTSDLADGGAGWEAVVEALEASASAAQPPEAPECSVSLAAAELLAAHAGKPGRDLPAPADGWVKRQKRAPGSHVIELARRAIARVRDDSELRDLWKASPEFDAWLADLAGLESRLAK